MGKAIDYIAENQQSKKSHNHHGKKFHGQDVAELLYALEIEQNTIATQKSTGPEKKADCTKYQESYPEAFLITFPQVVKSRKKTWF